MRAAESCGLVVTKPPTLITSSVIKQMKVMFYRDVDWSIILGIIHIALMQIMLADNSGSGVYLGMLLTVTSRAASLPKIAGDALKNGLHKA